MYLYVQACTSPPNKLSFGAPNLLFYELGLIFHSLCIYKLHIKCRVCKIINPFSSGYLYVTVDIVFRSSSVHPVPALNFLYPWYCPRRSGVLGVIPEVNVAVGLVRYVAFYFSNIWNYTKYYGCFKFQYNLSNEITEYCI